MKKWLSLLLVVVMVAAAIPLMGCGEEEEKAVYKIGAVLAITGPASNLGKPEENTLEMIQEQINKAGGINGHPLEIIIYNTETNAQKCVTMVERLIQQDNVLAIVGPSTSGESMALIPTVTQAKVSLVSCAASIDIVTPINERFWIFKTPQTELQAIHEIYAYLQGEGITKIAIITNTSGFGAAGKKYLESDASEFGLTIVNAQTFDDGDTDMTSQLANINGDNPQAVICWSTDKESAVCAQNMKTLQMTMPLFCSHGIANKAFIDQAGDAANGVIFPAGKLLILDKLPASDKQKPVLINYKTDYEALYGADTVNTFGGHAYDAVWIVIKALENLGNTLEYLGTVEARAELRDEIEKTTNFVGTGGIFNMSPTDHLGMAAGSLALIKIVSGEWTWLQ